MFEGVPNITSIPRGVLGICFSFLSFEDLVKIRNTCRCFEQTITKDSKISAIQLGTEVSVSRLEKAFSSFENLASVQKLSIPCIPSLSVLSLFSGLLSLDIDDRSPDGSADLAHFLCQSTQLKSLRICCSQPDMPIHNAVKSMSNLESLDLFYDTAESVIISALSCLHLRDLRIDALNGLSVDTITTFADHGHSITRFVIDHYHIAQREVPEDIQVKIEESSKPFALSELKLGTMQPCPISRNFCPILKISPSLTKLDMSIPYEDAVDLFAQHFPALIDLQLFLTDNEVDLGTFLDRVSSSCPNLQSLSIWPEEISQISIDDLLKMVPLFGHSLCALDFSKTGWSDFDMTKFVEFLNCTPLLENFEFGCQQDGWEEEAQALFEQAMKLKSEVKVRPDARFQVHHSGEYDPFLRPFLALFSMSPVDFYDDPVEGTALDQDIVNVLQSVDYHPDFCLHVNFSVSFSSSELVVDPLHELRLATGTTFSETLLIALKFPKWSFIAFSWDIMPSDKSSQKKLLEEADSFSMVSALAQIFSGGRAETDLVWHVMVAGAFVSEPDILIIIQESGGLEKLLDDFMKEKLTKMTAAWNAQMIKNRPALDKDLCEIITKQRHKQNGAN